MWIVYSTRKYGTRYYTSGTSGRSGGPLPRVEGGAEYWDDVQNQRQLFEELGTKMNITGLQDWYNITLTDLKAKSMGDRLGYFVVRDHYDNSLQRALARIYPEYPWDPWKFPKHKGFWTETSHREYMDWIARQLNVTKLDDWYSITTADVAKYGASSLLKDYYSDSLYKALLKIYPEHKWLPWKFPRVSSKLYSDKQVQRQFFDYIAQELNINDVKDWTSVKYEDITKRGGKTILSFYDNSLQNALSAVYPEYNRVRFQAHKYKGHWNDITNHTKFFDNVASDICLQQLDDWYKVKAADIYERGGHSLLTYYGHSLYRALQTVYPKHKWFPWKFAKVPDKFWDDKENHKKYLVWLAEELGVKSTEDWYKVKFKDFKEHGGAGLLALHYNYSLIQALQANFPEARFEVWRFEQTPKRFFDVEENAKAFLMSVSNQLGITKLDEWYSILYIYYGGTLLKKNGGLLQMLTNHYPTMTEGSILRTTPSKQQVYLFKMLQAIFPNQNIILDYSRKDLVYFKSQREMRLDVFIPGHNLAFEYQGKQHYNFHYLYGSPLDQQQRDQEKRLLCNRLGITLIDVPFWWDEKENSLLATIHKFRPDLIKLPSNSVPIPEEQPSNEKFKVRVASDIHLGRSENWEGNIDPTGFWVSPKVTGVRVAWNGSTTLVLTNGQSVPAPESFIRQLPPIAMDGVLHIPNTSFDQCMKVLHDISSARWQYIQFHVFDAPTHHHLVYEERLALLKRAVHDNSLVHLIPSTQCNGKTALQSQLKHYQQQGYSGLVLRKPKSHYYSKGSFFSLQEHKAGKALTVQIDTHSVQCKLPNGRMFSLPMISPVVVPLNAVVNFWYDKLDNSQIPVNPRFDKMRPDLMWKDILDEQPYVISFGKRGGVPRCRGCKQELPKDKLRLQVLGHFQPPGSGPYYGKVSFCVNPSCVEAAVQNYKKREVFLPQWTGDVLVSSNVKQQDLSSLQAPSAYHWIFQDTIPPYNNTSTIP